MDQRVFRWFGQVERQDEYSKARRVFMVGRPRLGWMDGVKVALGAEGRRWRLRDNVRNIGSSGEPWCICNYN